MRHGDDVVLGDQRGATDVGQIYPFGVVKRRVPRELGLLAFLAVGDQRPRLDL